MGANMLRRWRKDAETLGPKPFCVQDLARDEELVRLKRGLGWVNRGRDFLRNAAAYFAKEPTHGFSA